MKAITKLFLVIFAAITCFGCEKIENDNNKGQNTQEDFYYVRFDANAPHSLGSVKISLTGCESYSFTSNGSTTFSEILGPAPKGAIAKISVGSGITSIHVSKNNSPFALKKTGGLTLSYTIDF
ncbi:MAG: hypothetical protein II323_04975 [Tidjanibacter sp.]|nr:hypothetical protein [Tidjanibacter sp.]